MEERTKPQLFVAVLFGVGLLVTLGAVVFADLRRRNWGDPAAPQEQG